MIQIIYQVHIQGFVFFIIQLIQNLRVQITFLLGFHAIQVTHAHIHFYMCCYFLESAIVFNHIQFILKLVQTGISTKCK